ncbi:MAG: hypothetical protein MUF71_14570 [Candidatus Kapabacteria bacterium]|jgi:hypothetical protein|nr:hypothetical protein [Candidatus Kapabacteria bacterium]
MHKRFLIICLLLLTGLTGCMQNYESVVVLIHNSLLPKDGEHSLIVRFSLGQAKDSVMIFPVVGGRIVGISEYVGFRYIIDNSQEVLLLRRTFSNGEQSVLPNTSQSNDKLENLRVNLDSVTLYQAKFSQEKEKQNDLLYEGIGIPKQYTELQAQLPLGFDSTLYVLNAHNTTKDTCFITYSTQELTNIRLRIPPFGGNVQLTSFVLVISTTNKDLGNDVKSYLPDISVMLKDSAGKETTVFERTRQQPLLRSELNYRYTLGSRRASIQGQQVHGYAEYTLPIRR